MGYRSEVSLTLTREAVSDLFKTIPDEFNNLLKWSDSFTKKDNAFHIKWTYIKWYESYAEIAALRDCLHDIGGDNYYLLRIGEDNADIEELGNFWDSPFQASVVRSIDVDYGDSEPVDLKVFQ